METLWDSQKLEIRCFRDFQWADMVKGSYASVYVVPFVVWSMIYYTNRSVLIVE